jgi:cytochrome c oxidase cbb3-type subunit I/II
VPRLYGTTLHSVRAANAHFYLATFGILLYAAAMWTSGVTQGLMWRAENEAGGLMYPNFVETLIAIRPMYAMRLIGGTAYLVGFCMMAWNLVLTAKSGKPVDGEVEVVVKSEPETHGFFGIVLGTPVLMCIAGLALLASLAFLGPLGNTLGIAGMIAVSAAILYFDREKKLGQSSWHHIVEGRALPFTVLTVGAVLIGGIAEIVPIVIAGNAKLGTTKQQPYTGLELEGRDVFLREGCYNCHSQMIRPLSWETARYGAASTEDDSLFDHPFQWGSKRTGPDLARVGGRYSDVWHYRHLLDPRELSPGSNMPTYAYLETTRIDFTGTPDKLRAMRTVGVPYTPEQIATAAQDAQAAANVIAATLRAEAGAEVPPDSEVVALIAYLQRLGHPQAPAIAPKAAVAAIGGQ